MARNIIGLSALMVASMAFAQDGDAFKIGFETDDYRSVSVYDTWEASRSGQVYFPEMRL